VYTNQIWVLLTCDKKLSPFSPYSYTHENKSDNGKTKPNKKDGYRQRNVRQFLHILASPGYAPGIIAVNVTWMERGLNAGPMHRSIYPSIFNRLRTIARYWSEIAIFFYLLYLTPPLWVFPLEFREKVWSSAN